MPSFGSETQTHSEHGHTPAWPDVSSGSLSSTSTSLSSSFSSSAASSMLPAAPPSNSSQSDINSSDHSALTAAPANTPHLAVSPRPRSSSLAIPMGQNYSRAHSPTPVSPSSQLASKGIALGNAAAATGNKLKRAFAARRKKSEDASSFFSNSSKGKEREPSSPQPLPQVQVFGGKKLARTPKTHASPLPPLPPPKPAVMQIERKLPPAPVDINPVKVDQRGSLMPISPGISSALNFMRIDEAQREQERISAEARERESEKVEPEKVEKEAWRKSDSTMSHHTIRPGATMGSRTPRPVSMAESLQSTHTIVPINKRLSALVTDADFGMPEEDDSFKSSEEGPNAPAVAKISPTSSLRTKNRRSLSLNIGTSNFYSKPQVSPPMTSELKQPSKSISEGVPISPPASRETHTLTKAAANGIISPSSVGMQSTGNNIRGRLAAWSATTNNPRSTSRQERALPQTPVDQHQPPLMPPGHPQAPSFRQTAISMTSGLAPAAGLAKRAVERMGRAFGGMSSSSSNSGYSSSSSGTAPSSYSSVSNIDNVLARTHSNQSAPSRKTRPRRTPNAPSGGSISSSIASSLSDSDAFSMPAGPYLGKRLRGPMRMKSGGAGVAGGIVFGRDLQSVVRDTAVSVSRFSAEGRGGQHQGHGRKGSVNKEDLRALEGRMLPALVVRCAQHLMIWGIQEEGLFRLNGRPAHVAKLRTEFDTGADYDMKECTPGDLDPHAVASIFKAYIRELPEPLLTQALLPYFDAAMSQESTSTPSEESSLLGRGGAKGPSLPSGPRSGLPAMRKPPSLSTLAMPSFTGMRPPSNSLLKALRALIAQLPQENRDLIRTVTELIKATAKESRVTKMPLNNLLLLFCPSLNMNPPLLRALCEGEDLWDPRLEDSPVIDIRRESVAVLDDGPPPLPNKDGEVEVAEDGVEDEFSDAHDGTESVSAENLEAGPEAVGDNTSELQALEGSYKVRSRPVGARRIPVATIYMDSESGYDDTSSLAKMSTVAAAPNAAFPRTPSATASDTMSLQDDVSYVSTSEGYPSVPSPNRHREGSSPQPSSSAESLVTPSTSSGNPSFSRLPIENDQFAKRQVPGSPIIADSTPLPLQPTPRRPVISNPIISSVIISNPIQFPTSGSAPPTPNLVSKRSTPILSLPNFSPLSEPPSSPTSSDCSSPRTRRLKRPSLHLLFSKRSDSPLASPSTRFISGPSPYLQPPRAASDSSVSTPVSAVTAPQSSTFTLPPVLNTPIESSPLRLGLGINSEQSEPMGHNSATDKVAATQAPRPLPSIPSDEASTSSLNAMSALPRSFKLGYTPIADRFRSPSSSALSLVNPSVNSLEILPAPVPRTKPTLRTTQSNVSISSVASSNHLGLLDDEDKEDWTSSVLLAADMDSGWCIKHANR